MSSYVKVVPEAFAAASGDLTGIGEALEGATAAAAPNFRKSRLLVFMIVDFL